MNGDVQIFLRDPAFSSVGYIPRSGIAGSYGGHTFLKDGFRAFHQRLMEPTPSPREKQPSAPALEREAIFPRGPHGADSSYHIPWESKSCPNNFRIFRNI